MIDMIISKGLALLTVLKLFLLTLPFLMAMTIPMAVLVAVVLAFGRLSADNEITIMKACGINLFRLIRPIALLAVLLSMGMLYFNDAILPETNHKFKNLMIAIHRKVPTLSIEEGVFIDDFDGYQIYIREKDDKQAQIYGVIIHEMGPDKRISRSILAQWGVIEYDQTSEIFSITLHDGEIHELDATDRTNYRRMNFDTQKMNLQIDTSLKEEVTSSRGDRELSIDAMLKKIDFFEQEKENTYRKIDHLKKQLNEFEQDSMAIATNDSLAELVFQKQRARLMADKAVKPGSFDRHHLRTELEQQDARLQSLDRSISRYHVEIQKKYALPFACIVFVFIGAPFGVMGRRGAGIVLSLIAFVFYYICLIGGEELADRQLLSPYVAMWAANFILGILGVILLIRTNSERVIINAKWFIGFLPGTWRRKIAAFFQPQTD